MTSDPFLPVTQGSVRFQCIMKRTLLFKGYLILRQFYHHLASGHLGCNGFYRIRGKRNLFRFILFFFSERFFLNIGLSFQSFLFFPGILFQHIFHALQTFHNCRQSFFLT